jgi:hypothetical protein
VTEEPASYDAARNLGGLWSPREILLAVCLSLVVLLSSSDAIDRHAEDDLDSLFQRALITFALARTLNGLISAMQGTEVALQPAGVGVTLTPGEILDPVNDLVERFSWIMLGATISLGIQQVLLDVGHWWGLQVALAILAPGWLLLRLIRRKKSAQHPSHFETVLLYGLIASIFIRFAVPLALIANEAVYEMFLESRYLASTQELESVGEAIGKAEVNPNGASASTETGSDGQSRSMLGQVMDGARRALDFEQKLAAMKKRTGELIEHLIQLSVVFILQTGILPLLFLWLLLSLFRAILRSRPRFHALS